MAAHADLAQYIKAQGEPGRFTYDDQEIPYNIGDWYRIESFNAYAASIQASLWANDIFAPRVAHILGIRYYLGQTAARPRHTEGCPASSGPNTSENTPPSPPP